MNWSLLPVALVPPAGVVTVMSTAPVPAGGTAGIWVALPTVCEVAWVPPNWTAVAPVKPVPVIVTLVPPADGPFDGLTAVTVGAGLYMNWSAAVAELVPPAGVVIVMSTVPGAPAGTV